MYYLIDIERKRLLHHPVEDFEELKEFVLDSTQETEIKLALKSLGAIIAMDVYPYLLTNP